MCFDLDSEPPIPRISGAAVSHEDLTLASEDGNRFAAFRAVADGGPGPGVVILPDVRGLYRFYEELALRFAERGITAVAFDYFGRTAGAEKRGEDFEYKPHGEQLTPHQVMDDTGTCIRHLLALDCTSFFTVGFCLGGSYSWIASAFHDEIDGAVGFYGRPSRALPFVSDLRAPILAFQGGADQAISHEDNLEFEHALAEAGKEYELIEYEGAPHSFFDRKQEEFQEASDDAWRRTLEFIARHS